MESKHLIIGSGEIGKSIQEVLQTKFDVQMRDIESDVIGQFNYIHICFPYMDNFVEEVKKYQELYNPYRTVIHSTVKVGTIKQLGDGAVHIPIRGKHPDLAESIKSFRMYVGGNNLEAINDVAEIFKQVVDDVYILDYPAETTEVLKLLSTSYYGWNILFQKEAKRICDELDIPFEVVYEDANKSYNKGYVKMNLPQFVRPVLKDCPGKIGGHCVMANTELLDSYINSLIKFRNGDY